MHLGQLSHDRNLDSGSDVAEQLVQRQWIPVSGPFQVPGRRDYAVSGVLPRLSFLRCETGKERTRTLMA